MAARDVLIGSILAFAGAYSAQETALNALGWVLCDGSPVTPEDEWFAYLQPVIGTQFGGDGETIYLPDLRGYFIRGLDPTGSVDQDGGSRTAPQSGLPITGNSGLAIGSLQTDGVGPHNHEYAGNVSTFSGQPCPCECMKALVPSGSPATTDEGITSECSPIGTETRPVNMYVHFLIKARAMPALSIMAGTVLDYAGEDPAPTKSLLLCDGSALPPAATDLWSVIQSYYGANLDNQPLLPDYRGMFLRGVDLGRNIDPDSSGRNGPQPAAPHPGNTGDNVGSMQFPTLAPHSHGYSLPTCYCDLQPGCCGCPQGIGLPCCASDSTLPMDVSPPTISLEVRPMNASIFRVIVAETSTSGGAGLARVPVGAVVAYAGSSGGAGMDGWMPCDGTSLANGQYPALYAAIGDSYGAADQQHFCLPNYQGMFLRGVDQGRGLDVDAGARNPPSPSLPSAGNTGDAVGSVQPDAIQPHLHGLLLPGLGATVAAPSVTNFLSPNSTTADALNNTGFSDTRPVNMYLQYLIKVQ